MKKIFDHKIFQLLEKIVDCICLSVLWLVFSLPFVTIGASSTAVYYTINKVVRHERGMLFREFFGAFKKNFKQSTLVWLILVAIYCIWSLDCYMLYQMLAAGYAIGLMIAVFLVFFVAAAIWTCYLFPYMARFEDTTKTVLLNSFRIAFANIKETIFILIMTVIQVVLTVLSVPMGILFVGIYTLTINLIIEPVFKKYMSPEELEKEKQRNYIEK